MKRQPTPPGGDYQIRCPRLGHQISFDYCRHENQGLPCFKTLDCWYPHFLVEEYLRTELRPEDWDRIFSKPAKPKMISLLDLISQAKETKESTS